MKNQLLKNIKKAVIIILFAGVIFLPIIDNICIPINKVTVTVTVTDKKEDRFSKDIYVYILDEDGETRVFAIVEDLFRRWNSSDLDAKIEVGNTYKFTICRDGTIMPIIYEVELLE